MMAKSKGKRRGFTLRSQTLPSLVHTIDEISLDFNQVPPDGLIAMGRRIEAGDVTTIARLVERVVTAWPWPAPITAEGFVGLGMVDSQRVLTSIQTAAGRVLKRYEGKV